MHSVWGSEITCLVGLTYGMWCFALVEVTWVSDSLPASPLGKASPSCLSNQSITKRIPSKRNTLLSFSVLVAVAVECDVFYDTFPWDYSTNNILFPFCYAGSQSSTMSHQRRTNQRDPPYPPHSSVLWYSLLDNHHFHRFLSTRSNHSSIHSSI